MRLTQQDWWTPADEAELDLLTHELIGVAVLHRERCAVCRESRRSCAAIGEATAALLEWREGRILRSKAAYLRELQRLLGPRPGRRTA